MVLLISMTFSFAYLTSLANLPHQTEAKKEFNFIKEVINFFNVIPSVSAASLVSTCVNSRSGKSCQEFPTEQCATQCDGSCVPAQRTAVDACRLGTCYDSSRGICQVGSPRALCNSSTSAWYSDPNGNIPECRKGCCVLGTNTMFTTSQECTQRALAGGVQRNYKPEITTEIACLAFGSATDEGACVSTDSTGDRTCRFVTREVCVRTRGATFYKDSLCSKTELNTNCRPQVTARCIEGKSELYWFDSCGNKENIYDANKIKSYNNGVVQLRNETCLVGSADNPTANQLTCGNCNYLLGSTCGSKTVSEKVADSSINFVCKDLNCIDDKGVKHNHGESWCYYQGSIGVDETNNRATDTAGSRHFRLTCNRGEITKESCGDYRTGICVESSATSGAASFTSAACRANHAVECLNYNTENNLDLCAQNPDCFLKNVKVGNHEKDKFNFTICTPRYSPGFDLQNRAGSAQGICSMATINCTKKEVRTFFHGWEPQANPSCDSAEFTEQMNNLCMSLGDCGAKANYVGTVTQNYKIKTIADGRTYNDPKLSAIYLALLSRYKNPRMNQQPADPGADFFEGINLGVPGDLNSFQEQENAAVDKMLMTGGAIGVTLYSLAYFGSYFGAGAGATGIGAGIAGAGSVLSNIPGLGGLAAHVAVPAPTLAATPAVEYVVTDAFGVSEAGTSLAATPTTSAALGGALAGAAIGLAATALLIKASGIGGGLSSGETTALLALGTVAGTAAGLTLTGATATGATAFGGALAGVSWIPVVGWIAGAIAVIGIAVGSIIGVGDTREKNLVFTCQPWQAPFGGSECSKCGEDGMPCSRYACESLGQTCQLVNEGTSQAGCVSNSRNDVSAPQLGPQNGILPDGYRYIPTGDGTGTGSGNGFRVEGPNGCLPAFTQLPFGISTTELSQCRYDTQRTNGYEEMGYSFGGSSLFSLNHTAIFNLPSLESLGVSGNAPSAQADYSLYVRCIDKNGNPNINEYAISFCISAGPDVIPPRISRGTPLTENIAFGLTSQESTIYTNEPAECKWSLVNKAYAEMENTLGCANRLEDQRDSGWMCSTTFPLTGADSRFYIRCLDQPWLNMSDPANAGKTRNANPDSFVFNLKQTNTPLNITSISPDNVTLTFNVSPVSVNFVVQTVGGEDGTAVCEGRFGENFVRFFETGGRTHRWTLNQFTAGEKEMFVRCTDDVGNVATKSARFRINIDITSPQITRVYSETTTGANLMIITDENSTCYFNRYSCNYGVNNATAMSGTALVHSTPLNSNFNYYIKCKDPLGNVPGACTLTVRKGDLS